MNIMFRKRQAFSERLVLVGGDPIVFLWLLKSNHTSRLLRSYCFIFLSPLSCWENTSKHNYHKKSRSYFCNLAPFGKDIKVRRTAATAFLHLINKTGNCFVSFLPVFRCFTSGAPQECALTLIRISR